MNKKYRNVLIAISLGFMWFLTGLILQEIVMNFYLGETFSLWFKLLMLCGPAILISLIFAIFSHNKNQKDISLILISFLVASFAYKCFFVSYWILISNLLNLLVILGDVVTSATVYMLAISVLNKVSKKQAR